MKMTTGRYSTDQKKPNRERVCERERNGYRTGMRTGTERVQNGSGTDKERVRNGNGTDTERIQNGNSSKKLKKCVT